MTRLEEIKTHMYFDNQAGGDVNYLLEHIEELQRGLEIQTRLLNAKREDCANVTKLNFDLIDQVSKLEKVCKAAYAVYYSANKHVDGSTIVDGFAMFVLDNALFKLKPEEEFQDDEDEVPTPLFIHGLD